jgi:hypothetical protein
MFDCLTANVGSAFANEHDNLSQLFGSPILPGEASIFSGYTPPMPLPPACLLHPHDFVA